ncbi:transmembrane 238 [Pelobates cultripes]|uniref:Transmembrane 238 n=1 Tax=Pelobates cultripes TaxID=61616 RepID=A0AAD1T9C8_PELCU|nr:transmembrane 238 [Pelobates cultripes]
MAPNALDRCRLALLFAVVMDLVGIASLLVGIFAELQLNGQDFGDLLIYTGAILVFLSLIGWIFWYTGNIEISLEELQQDYMVKDGTLARLARKISRHLSHRDLKRERRWKNSGQGGSNKPDTLQLSKAKVPKQEMLTGVHEDAYFSG